MIGFPRVQCIVNIHIFIYLYHLREYAWYTCMQFRKLHQSRGLGQLMGVARNTTRA